MSIKTGLPSTTGRFYAEMTDGRLTTLQLGRTAPDRHQRIAVLDEVRTLITQLIAAHTDDALSDLLAIEPDEPDHAREAVQLFHRRFLDDLGPWPDDEPLPSDGFPSEASGTAPNGDASAVISGGQLITLECAPALFDDTTTFPAEAAIRAAVNAALQDQEAAVLAHAQRVDTSRSDSPGWAELATRLDRLERGLL